ncbi:ABC transporter permease [Nannocystis punicea]|uniref:ABC transporter permease n=1 Tax=Nannocystis punicea TaxID=2995304 RepID=A0ABY7GTZ3_9BACT|nr:FtsX-like permease family protein [Nannocystis poenicansa]WAS90426.1 ABC transporter permease [Nannocystis poenicansa]
MATSRRRWALIALVARRMLLREGRRGAGRAASAVLWTAAALAIAGVAATLLGVRSVGPPLVAGMAALVAVGLACARHLMPAVAVAVFGTGLGCAALITVLGVTSGFERELVGRLSKVGGHVTLTEYGLDFDEYPQVVARWGPDPRVLAVSPFAFSTAAVVPLQKDGPEDRSNATGVEGHGQEDMSGETHVRPIDRNAPVIALIKGVEPQLAAALPGTVAMLRAGDLRAIRPGDVRHGPAIALGSRLADRLGVKVGDSVRLVVPAELDGTAAAMTRPPRHGEYEVVDLLDTGVGDYDASLALVHLSAAQALFFAERRVSGVEFALREPDSASAFAQELVRSMGDGFRATTWEQQGEDVLAGLRQIRAAVSLVLGLLEVVAATALLASLLLLVRRKREEIAALMSLGADSRAIFAIFEAVGVFAGVLGTLIGVGLGLAFGWMVAVFRYPLDPEVYPVDHLPFALSWIDLAGPAMAALIICALASGPVALVASRLPLLAGLGRA